MNKQIKELQRQIEILGKIQENLQKMIIITNEKVDILSERIKIIMRSTWFLG